MKKVFLKHLLLFLIGGCCYFGIEILARGYSHWTMVVVGGICFVLIGLLNEKTENIPFVKQMVYSAILITIIELISGCILNLWLKLDIWDYSDNPFNLLGQICLSHTIYWFFLSAVGILLDDYLRYKIFQEEKPIYTLW